MTPLPVVNVDVAMDIAREAYREMGWRPACGDTPNLFWPKQGETPTRRTEREAEAKAVCRACPLRIPCREKGRRESDQSVWGGETEAERRALGLKPGWWAHGDR